MVKVNTVKGTLNAVGAFLIPILADPGKGKAYRIQSLAASVASNGVAATEGLLFALQDGEVEEALLDRATSAGKLTPFVSNDEPFVGNLQIYGSVAISGAGTGGAAHESNQHVFPESYVTAQEQFIVARSLDTAVSRYLIHVQYDEFRLSQSDWVELKHRSSAVDRILGTQA